MPKCIPVEGSPGFFCNGGDVEITQDEWSAFVSTPNIKVRCHGMVASRFGYPNDEALSGDPLYDCGLKFYDCIEIIDSPWLKEINRRNKNPFPTDSGFKSRHFYMAFHDSVFEVLCDTITFEELSEAMHLTLHPCHFGCWASPHPPCRRFRAGHR